MLWICTKCWTIMPRAEAEALAVGGKDAITTRCRCSSCGTIGQFASDSSEEFCGFANDLAFDAFAAHLQKAGYEGFAPIYSQECDHGDHAHCAGKNRLRRLVILAKVRQSPQYR